MPLFAISVISKLLLLAGLTGLFSSSVYAGMTIAASARFARRRKLRTRFRSDFANPLSLLKPLHGSEPGLEERLKGFFEQDYPGYEIIFCARSFDDAGLQLARRVAEKHPRIPVQFLATGEPAYTNAKVSSLELMAEAATHDIFVISDSDVSVGRSYLREVAAPFADPNVGLGTCLYRGVAHCGKFWPRLEAAAMSIEMTSGVLVAEWLEGMQFALGPTMVVRRECVEEIGGFGMLGRYCADDFVLGNAIAAKGHAVVLSDHVIDHVILNSRFWQSMNHQARWMKSTRFSRPKGHFGTALTFSVPFGVMAFGACAALGSPWLGAAALAWSVATRMLMAAMVGKLVVEERNPWQTVLLYPLRDLMGFGFWAASYGSNKILWRGEVFELLKDGVMRRYHPRVTVKTVGEETLLPPKP